MARRSPVKVGLALALIFVITSVATEDKCRTGCQGAAQTFKYQEGTTYKYNFDSKIEVTLSSAEGQKQTTEVKAQVLLTQQPQCNQILRVQNLQIIGADGKKHTQIPDIDKPIKLNFNDGNLEDSICIVQGDTQNSLNIKRAIASIFQANLKTGHETDVFGLCPTEVTHQKEGNLLTVQKSRNLNRCAFRESVKQDFLATAFNLNSEIKSSPLLNSDYKAKLKIKAGILDQATITEDYLFVPFSVGQGGAKTTIETTLKFTGTGKDNPSQKFATPRSIIFEDPHPIVSPTSNVNSILTAVRDTARTITVTVSDNTAKEFVNLVKILRVSKKDDLLAVFSQVKAGVGFSDKEAARKLFLDALLRAGNGDTVEAALTLLKSNELSAVEQKFVYLGFNLVRHTTENSIAAAAQLLNQPNLPREAYLGIGSLAGRHCRQHSCKNVESINRLIQTLIQKLGNGKADNRDKENDIVYALKALTNTGFLPDNIVGKITAIAADKNAPTRLRVTALETYLADPCKDKLQNSALTILKDIQQDSEIRIKAYLVLVQCPTAKIANAIKTLLEQEESYQVGGFITSHIRNIRSSANPDKELAKQHFGQISVSKKFPFDLRKYSANGEFSYTVDTLGISNSIESNVIYSQKSFLPRSTSLNLTAEVFGHTFNFLELETRQENLDRLVEHYLGPKSLLRTKGFEELWNNKHEHAKSFLHNFAERVEKSLRSRRDVSRGEIDKIARQIAVKTNDLNKDLDLDFSVKAFGSEVLFVNVNDDAQKFTPEAIADKIINGLNQGLDHIKNFDETLRSNLLFIDAEFAYPTSSGFPLRLGVEGSSNIQVKASGSVDLRSLFRRDTTVKISLIPSANIEVAGRLTIDTLLVESGLKTISSLHTATGGDLIVDLFSKGVDVKFSLPVEKQSLVSASHDVVFHNRELGAIEKNQPLKFAQNKDFSICLDQLNALIGLTFCVEATGPNLVGKQVPVLPFPLSGDAKLAVFIEKEDVSQYHFRHVIYDEAGKHGAQINIETLSKTGEKKVSLEIEAFLRPEQFIKATLTSPIVTAAVEGRITVTEQEQSLSLRLQHDQSEFFGKIGVGIEGSPARAAYRPILQYRTPQTKGLQTPPYRVEGQIIVERNGPQIKYIFDNLRVVVPNSKTISVNGNLGEERDGVFADITASDGQSSGSLKGKLQFYPSQLKYNVEVKNSFNPDANINVKGELQRNLEEHEMKHFLQIVHGNDLSSKTNILKVENSWKLKNKGPQEYLVETKNKLTYPLLSTDLQFDFKLDPKDVDYNFLIQYKDVKFGSELDFEHVKKVDGIDYDLEWEVYGLNNKVEVKAKRKVSGQHSQIENSVDVNGKKFEVNGKVTHRLKPNDIAVGADLVIKSPTHGPVKVVNGFKLNSNDLDAFQKISSGGTVFADVFIKANKNGDANGAVKINLKDKLLINGQLKANKGAGSGDITIELPGVKRITKADTTFTIHEPQYNVAFNIYPIFNEDPTKKIAFSTNTRATLTSIDSKNLLDIINHKLEVNIKGSRQGEWKNGKVIGEIDVTLPNDHYLAAKLNRELRNNDNVLNGNLVASLEHRKNKNTPGGKVSLIGNLRNTKTEDKKIDVDYKLSFENGGGKDFHVDLAIKTTPQGDILHSEISNKIYGASLPGPIETKFTGTCEHLKHSFDLTFSGLERNLKVGGKFDVSSTPITGAIKVDHSAPTCTILKSLNVDLSGSLSKLDGIDASGQAVINAYSPQQPLVEFKGDGNIKVSDKEGRVKGNAEVGRGKKVGIDAGFSRVEEKDKQKIQGDLSLNYGNGQSVKGDVVLVRLPKHEYKLDVKLNTPTEKFKQNRLQVHTKRNDDNSRHESEVTLSSDGKTYTFNSDLHLSEISPSIDLKLKNAEGKLSQLTATINKLSNQQFGAELKIVNQPKDFLLEGEIDANVQSVDEFHIKGKINSPALKLDKIEFDAQNKAAKSGKRIQVSAKSAGKNVLSGSTSYSTREEHGKLIVEGSGSFKLKDESKSSNFKYIRQNLSQDKNGETGIEISFDGALGNKAIDAEFKVTNKQFRIANSYCEEKEQCAHVEIDAKTIADELSHYNHELEISVDLRKLGLSHEFGLKAVTNRKEYQLDHTIDIHFQSQANNKYQYSFYIHPREAGVTLTTPRRIIALEANANAPKTLFRDGGKITAEFVLYLDKKNQPNQKSGVVGFLNVNPNGQAVEGEVKFTNPGLQRPLSITWSSQLINKNRFDSQVVFDVFAQPAQKIVIKNSEIYQSSGDNQVSYLHNFEIKSAGLNIDIKLEEKAELNREQYTGGYHLDVKYHVGSSVYNSAANFEVSPRNINVLLRAINIDILKLNSKLQLSKDQQIIDTDVSSYGLKPTSSHLEIKNYNTVKYILERKDTRDKLQINSGFIPGQIADFRAEIIKNGANNELVRATIKLDETNFLKSDYNVNSKNIQELVLNPAKAEISNHIEELKKLTAELNNNFAKEVKNVGEIAKRATPNLSPLKDYYQGELKKIKDEILADKTIKDISEFLHSVLSAVSQVFGDTFNHFSQLVESLVQTFQASFSKVLEGIEKELLPKLKNLSEQLLALASEIFDKVSDVVLTYLAKISQIVEKYQPEFKQLGAAFGEVTQDVVRVIVKAYEGVRDIVTEQLKKICDEIKALPAFEALKAEYDNIVKEGFLSSENFANTVKDLFSTLRDLAPSEELKALVDSIAQYVNQKLTNQKVDDIAALDKIAKAILTVFRTIFGALAAGESADIHGFKLPLPINIFSNLPKIVASRFSPLSYILREDIPDTSAFFLSLVNHPRNWVAPFPLYGLVAQGQHLFTFDGKHLTFPGQCNYVLVHDAVDGNFSVIGTYEGGLLTAITLSEGRDTVTIKKGGQVLLNNSPTDLPARKPNIAAFRNYERVELVTYAGVHIICGLELTVCSVTVSGFYHGKLRGLLGNGNNDPYDDFTLANGKIVTSESEFGNSFKVTPSCAAVQTVPHHGVHHSVPSCDKLFGYDSGLRYCYWFVRPENFKTACEHGVAAGVKDTEFAIAIAYTAACLNHGIPVHVPSEFLKCTNGDKPTVVGDKFSVKTPAKSADIVVLVDTIKKNEQVYKEYVTPLIQQLTNELTQKGISDIDFHLITYGGENQWPSHVTVNGKLTFKGKAPEVKFSEAPTKTALVTGCRQADRFFEVLKSIGYDIKLALGLHLQAQTYNEGFEYPFRANSIKSIIAVVGNACEVGVFYPVQVLRTLLYRSKTINLNVITPFSKFSVKDDKHTKDVIGFNSQTVFTTSSKAKGKANSELYKDLEYNDYCVDFTLQNGGNVFVLDNFIAAKGGARKTFVQTTSHNIVEQFLSQEQGLDCECQVTGAFSAKNVCTVVQSKPRKVGGAKS